MTYLNAGCGNVILPAPRPAHHGLINDNIHQYPEWWNVDRVQLDGVDEVANLFRYPWPWPDNKFSGALLAHICEHIPHTLKAWDSFFSDGWFAFFSEMARVLQPESQIYILSPYANSPGALADPTHTRQLIPATFMHSMVLQDDDAPFEYRTGNARFRLAGETPVQHALTPAYQHMAQWPDVINRELDRHLNVCHEFAITLEVVKP